MVRGNKRNRVEGGTSPNPPSPSSPSSRRKGKRTIHREPSRIPDPLPKYVSPKTQQNFESIFSRKKILLGRKINFYDSIGIGNLF